MSKSLIIWFINWYNIAITANIAKYRRNERFELTITS